MKKIAMFVAAFILLASSWQTFYQSGRLVVHESGEGSAVCYDGAAEDYDGHCVSPVAPTWQYEKKQLDEQMGLR